MKGRIVLGLFLLLIAAAQAVACQQINSPQTITLDQNIVSSSTCFIVSANDVTIDCRGRSITVLGMNAKAIVAKGKTTVRNCNIETKDAGATGILVQLAELKLYDSTITTNGIHAPAISSRGSNLLIENNRLTANGGFSHGIELLDSTAQITDNTITADDASSLGVYANRNSQKILRNNIITGSQSLCMFGTSGCDVKANSLQGTAKLVQSSSNNFEDNTIEMAVLGLELVSSDSNTFNQTIGIGTEQGAALRDSSFNTLLDTIVNETGGLWPISTTGEQNTIGTSQVSGSSQITNSQVEKSTVEDSIILDSQVEKGTIINSTIDPTKVSNCTVINSVVTDSFLKNCDIINSTLMNENVVHDAIVNGVRLCGNGITDSREECDDGNRQDGDGCSASCRNEISECGNSIVEFDEECDDGNTIDYDGCSAICLIEHPECGNGIVEYNETCDDNNTMNGDGCDSTCHLEEAVCGNGVIEMGEECDDGNTDEYDGCSPICLIEHPECGNGIVEYNETCDDNNTINWDGCDSTCHIEIPVCGNGHVQEGEECDDGNLENSDGCSALCELERPVRPILECVLDKHGVYEAFFGHLNENNHTIIIPAGQNNSFSPAPIDRGQTQSFWPGRSDYYPNSSFSVEFDGSPLVWILMSTDGSTRTATASSDPAQACPPICGNGVLEEGEECDDGNNIDGDTCSATCLAEQIICGAYSELRMGLESPTTIERITYLTASNKTLPEDMLSNIQPPYYANASTDKENAYNAFNSNGSWTAQTAQQWISVILDNKAMPTGMRLQTSDKPTAFTIFGRRYTNWTRLLVVTNTTAHPWGEWEDNKTFTFGCEVKCGNGQIENGEECDDGNYLNDDGCSEICEVETAKKIDPKLECVLEHNGIYTAFFGYDNKNDYAIGIPRGPDNKFTPNPEYRGQTEAFWPGRSPEYPQSAFTVDFDGSPITWVLTGPDGKTRSVTASDRGHKCRPVCGNAIVEKNEDCDDGNTANGDGCSSRCKEEQPMSIIPILDCVVHNGTYEAFFGYMNQHEYNVTIPAGDNNSFIPEPADRQQTTIFGPGRSATYPNSPFSVTFEEDQLVWTLTGPDGKTRMATADSSLDTICPAICGNGIIEKGEKCDDGNTADGDNCTSICK